MRRPTLVEARVVVAVVGRGERAIMLADGRPPCADARGPLTVAQKDDLWFVRIGEKYFDFPASTAHGG